MTSKQLAAWAKRRTWIHGDIDEAGPLRYARDVEQMIDVCITKPSYAECRGLDDPVCGLARFSVHGCNGAPTRAEFVAWLEKQA